MEWRSKFGNLVCAENIGSLCRTRTTVGRDLIEGKRWKREIFAVPRADSRSSTAFLPLLRSDIVKMLFFNLGDAARLIYGFNSRISFRGWSSPLFEGEIRRKYQI